MARGNFKTGAALEARDSPLAQAVNVISRSNSPQHVWSYWSPYFTQPCDSGSLFVLCLGLNFSRATLPNSWLHETIKPRRFSSEISLNSMHCTSFTQELNAFCKEIGTLTGKHPRCNLKLFPLSTLIHLICSNRFNQLVFARKTMCKNKSVRLMLSNIRMFTLWMCCFFWKYKRISPDRLTFFYLPQSDQAILTVLQPNCCCH